MVGEAGKKPDKWGKCMSVIRAKEVHGEAGEDRKWWKWGGGWSLKEGGQGSSHWEGHI